MSRDAILKNIRKHLPESRELPNFPPDKAIRFEDPIAQFSEILESVGGRAVPVQSVSEIQNDLANLEPFTSAKKTISTVEGISGTHDLNQVDDPHDLQDVDFALAAADFGVAENAALWLSDDKIHQRAILFIVQHLALTVPAADIVNNMHEAYSRLEFRKTGFGVFLSGPSKTADIEQSLVIGAHGSRSLTVYLVD